MVSENIRATLTVGEKTVDMADKPAAEDLIKDMLTETFPELKGGKMAEIRAELKNIRGVEVKSKVVDAKDSQSKVVTAVKFEYDGEPSEVEEILMLEAQNRPLNADLYSPQAALPLE
jgi:hypothetical protein